MSLVLVHGAATRSSVWDRLLPELAGLGEAVTPQRAYSGDWRRELDEVASLCASEVVIGVSGGATIGLGVALDGVPLRAAVLHEPAAGSLAPGLLDHVAAAWRRDGVAGFGAALYGPLWSPALAPDDPEAVARDFAMFRSFEPVAPAAPLRHVLLTVGERSPEIRHRSVAALATLTGASVAVVAGSGHAAHLDAPGAFADVIRSHLAATVPAN